MNRKVKRRLIVGLSTLLMVMVFLISTVLGNKLLVGVINYVVPEVRIELREGKLLSGGHFSFSFESAAFRLQANNAHLDLTWFDCATICIAFDVEKFKVETLASHLASEQAVVSDKPEATLGDEPISLPVSIGVSSLNINLLEVKAGGHRVSLDRLQLVATADNALVQIAKLHSQQLTIEQLAATQAKPSKLPENLSPLSLPSIKLPLALALPSFRIEKLTYQPYEQAPLTLDNLALDMFAKSQKLNIEEFAVRYGQSSAFVSLEYDLNVNTVKGSASLSHSKGAITLGVQGDLEQLNIQTKVSGEVSAKGRLSLSPAQQNWPFTLDTRLDKAPIEQLVSLSGFRLKGRGHANDYTFSITGHADLKSLYEQAERAYIDASVRGSLSHLDVTKSRIAMAQAYTELVAQLDWQQGIQLDLQGTLEQLPIPQIQQGPNTPLTSSDLGVLSGHYALSFKQRHVSWVAQVDDLKLHGNIAQLPLSIALKGQIDDQFKGHLQQAELSYGDSNINIIGELGEALDLTAKFDVAHSANTLLPINIIMRGQGSVDGLATAPKVKLQTQISEVDYANLSLRDVQLATDVDLNNDLAGQLALIVSEANLPGIENGRIALNAQGNRRAHSADITLNSEEASAALTLTGQVENERWLGQVNDGALSIKSFSMALNNSFDLQISQSGMSVSQHCWQIAAGQACLSANQQEQSGDASVSLMNVPVQVASAWMPDTMTAEGSITGESSLQWSNSQLDTLVGKLGLTNGKVVLFQPKTDMADEQKTLQEATLNIDTLNVLLNGDGNGAEVDWQVQLEKLGNFNGKVAFPNVKNPQDMKGFVDVNAIVLNEFTPYLRALAWPDIELAGQFGGRVEFASHAGQPLIFGQMRAKQVSVLSSYLPMQISDLNLDVDLRDNLIELNGQLKTPQDGFATISGKAALRPDVSLDVKLSGQRLFLTPMAGAEVAVSPDLHIQLAGEHLNIMGEVNVPFARFTLNELPEGAILVSEDQVILDDAEETQKATLFDYQADIDIKLLDDVRIVALGLDAYLHGELSLEKQLNTAILAAGEVSLREGKYTAFGQDLIIETGQLGFNGPLDKPYLNIRAIRNPETTADGVIAGVSVQGSIAAPELTIFSEPAMDQAEALAYLLNGEALGAGESSNNTMLAQFLLSKSIDKSKGLFTKAGKKLGLKDVNLAAKGSGDDTQVELSGYITPSVQVSYRVGVFASLSEIAVRYRIFSKLYIEATSGLYDSIDLLYKFDWGG
ncbi:translocation/assembly module TamB domain-containing protein [Pseudoalteromonas sp. SMS1]|uniref:translocation/assembly module TamB domain-containing protein n=1 Tax=Pseudoalteromonas sp. SMS1 TaxID=2908894 RepID=UPI001F245BC7|nr:translocation/assembly module TamB domain-containing protein [Pseudoalteromonas sp. SMS1]MCF2860329.1 translocation/assembly module TamB domain-containing protein [Pseudoalteromonas sp. SMS1]